MTSLHSHPDRLLRDHLLGAHEIAMAVLAGTSTAFSMSPPEVKNILQSAVLLHDAGKATPWFQDYIMKVNTPDAIPRHKMQHHGLLSALCAFSILQKILPGNFWAPILGFIMVRRHHGDLQDYGKLLTIEPDEWTVIEKQIPSLFYDELAGILTGFIPEGMLTKAALEKTCLDLRTGEYKLYRLKLDIQKRLTDDNLELYFLLNFLFSILLFADKQDAIINRPLMDQSRPLLPDEIVAFKQSMFDSEQNSFNTSRNRMFLEVSDTIGTLTSEQSILAINAPTGSGKSLAVFHAAALLQQQFGYSHIIYCLPYTSIIDQNARVYEKLLETSSLTADSQQLLKHHYLAPAAYKAKFQEESYSADQALFLLEHWQSRMVMTTFVQLVNSLVSNQNACLSRFFRMSNAVIILDETQCVPHRYWMLLNVVLTQVARLLHSCIILVTATMPLIFSEEKGEIVELVSSKKQFFAELGRIELDLRKIKDSSGPALMRISEFQEEMLLLVQENKAKNILIVLNTIRSAKEVYAFLKERQSTHKSYYLSTHILPGRRLEIIEEIRGMKSPRPALVIATQLIEAGVDLDFDLVVRDFAPLDNIFQVCGRCNRNGTKQERGRVFLYSLQSEEGFRYARIYDAFLLDKTYSVLAGNSIIAEKDFLQLAADYFQLVLDFHSEKSSKAILQGLAQLLYDEAIPNENILIKKEFWETGVFIEWDEQASNLWQEYQKIILDESGFSKNAKLKIIRNNLSSYIINVPRRMFPETYNGSMFYLNHERAIEYYDEELGFRTDILIPAASENAIW